MKSVSEHRFENNPKEKEFHDKFKEMFESNGAARKALSGITLGRSNDNQNFPTDFLNEKEEGICLSIIQWLGSPVGQNFLRDCGFTEKK